MHFNTQTSVL